jgi:hypothetical protein
MPELDASLFLGGAGKGPEADFRKIEVGNFQEDVDKVLTHYFKWKGDAIGLVGITTSKDNQRVDGATFFVRGKFKETTHKLNAEAIWETADPNCVIQLHLPSASQFRFVAGGLYSDFLPASHLQYQCEALQHGKPTTIIKPSDYNEAGVEDFALRMVCQLSRNSSAKKGILLRYAILLYPGSLTALTSRPTEQGPSWPGIKIASGEMPLGPKPTKPWGCPILPIIKTGTLFAKDSAAPSGDQLKRAIGNVMTEAGAHDGRSNGSSLREKWARLRQYPAENKTVEPSLTWPPPDPEPDNSGRT